MSEDDVHGRFLRLVAPRGAYQWIERPPDKESWVTRKREVLTPKHLRMGHPVGVRPSRAWAGFLVIDVDKDSPYHPGQRPEGIAELRTILAEQGIEGLITVQSSASTGIHLWAPLPEQSTPALARWLYRTITSTWFQVAPGVLELFPNIAAPGRLYNAIRLPLVAPDSVVLDEDLNPVHRDLERLLIEWQSCLQLNKDFSPGPINAEAPPSSAHKPGPAEAWDRLRRGWSGTGQTWPLAYDAAFIACCEGLQGKALQSRMCKLLSEAPGCQAWSRHWKDIKSGRYGESLAKYYSKQGANYRARRQETAPTPSLGRPARDPEHNQKLSNTRRSVLASAAMGIKESGLSFPNQTAAIDYLIKHMKATTETGMSKATMYRHLDLVRPLIKQIHA